MSTLYNAPEAWYVWQALPKKEHLAAQWVKTQTGRPCLCPRLAYKKKTRRGMVRFVEPLFPGYVFIHLKPADFYRRVMAAPGLRKILMYGDILPAVPETVIAEIRARVADETPQEVADPPLEPGTPVIITEGPFADWEALVSGLIPAKDRVRILLDFLGREMTLDMKPSELLPRDRNPKEALLPGARAAPPPDAS